MTMQLTHRTRTADTPRRTPDDLADAIESARDARLQAERELRKSEVARRHAGMALEVGIHPMTLDESRRAQLRAAYADAAAVVDEKRRALEQARSLESAAEVIANAIAADHLPSTALTDGLLQLMGSRQRSRMRDATSRARIARGPAPLSVRSTRQSDSQPQ